MGDGLGLVADAPPAESAALKACWAMSSGYCKNVKGVLLTFDNPAYTLPLLQREVTSPMAGLVDEQPFQMFWGVRAAFWR